MMLAFFFSGCVDVSQEAPSKNPTILSVDFSCDRDEDIWSLRLFADAWTSGGEVLMATDDRLEIHKLDSIRAAPHGEGDELLLQLSIQSNPDDAAGGSSTGFLCTDSQHAALSVRVGIFSFDNEQETDCWQWGPEMDFSSLDYPLCPEVDPSEQS